MIDSQGSHLLRIILGKGVWDRSPEPLKVTLKNSDLIVSSEGAREPSPTNKLCHIPKQALRKSC